MRIHNTLSRGLWHQNPVLGQMLGLCPLLAVSTTLKSALILGLATTLILCLGNVCISALRKGIMPSLRLPCFMLIFATITTLIELALQGVAYATFQRIGLFLPLIITNCTLLARAEAFASKNAIWPTLLDSLSMSLGFTVVLIAMGLIRSISAELSQLALQPAGAFFALALLTAGFQWLQQRSSKTSRTQHHNGDTLNDGKRIPVTEL